MNRSQLLAISAFLLGTTAADAAPDRAPDWTLDNRAQLSAKVPASVQAYQWSGPEDLSARVWLWREGTAGNRALMMRVDVTDDAFVQPFVGAEAWKADGLQVALGVPGSDEWFEIGLAKWPTENRAVAHVFRNVAGMENPWNKINVTHEVREGGVNYLARFPFADLGLSDELLETQGVRFNLLVNDRDEVAEEGPRESTLEIAPGIDGVKSAQKFPIVKFAPGVDDKIQITPAVPDPPPPARYTLDGPLTTEFVAGPSWAKPLPIYEVAVDHYQNQPGDAFANLEKNLPRLKAMGTGIVWLMPIFPRGKLKAFNSYYSVRDYKAINPDYGTADDLRSLVNKAHELGMYVILDWVPLHSSWDNAWIDEHRDFYNLDDKREIREVGPWKDVARFNYGTPEAPNMPLWLAMADAMKFWVREFKVDGFRADVAAAVPAPFWNWVRPQLNEIRPVWMLAEAQDSALHPAFDTSYAWTMETWMHELAKGNTNARALDKVLRDEAKRFPNGAGMMRFVVNHDTASKPDKFPVPADGIRALSVLTATLPGKPMIYSGQEAGMTEKGINTHTKNIDFSDDSMQEFYGTLLNFYQAHPALQSGEFSKIETSNDDDVFAFTRGQGTDRVLTVVNLSDREQKVTLKGGVIAGSYLSPFGGAALPFSDGTTLTLAPWAYMVGAQTAAK